MNEYSINELKMAWSALYNTDCNGIWQAVNCELARRLTKDEYANFITSQKKKPA